jgi:hypothetical protein
MAGPPAATGRPFRKSCGRPRPEPAAPVRTPFAPFLSVLNMQPLVTPLLASSPRRCLGGRPRGRRKPSAPTPPGRAPASHVSVRQTPRRPFYCPGTPQMEARPLSGTSPSRIPAWAAAARRFAPAALHGKRQPRVLTHAKQPPPPPSALAQGALCLRAAGPCSGLKARRRPFHHPCFVCTREAAQLPSPTLNTPSPEPLSTPPLQHTRPPFRLHLSHPLACFAPAAEHACCQPRQHCQQVCAIASHLGGGPAFHALHRQSPEVKLQPAPAPAAKSSLAVVGASTGAAHLPARAPILEQGPAQHARHRRLNAFASANASIPGGSLETGGASSPRERRQRRKRLSQCVTTILKRVTPALRARALLMQASSAVVRAPRRRARAAAGCMWRGADGQCL